MGNTAVTNGDLTVTDGDLTVTDTPDTTVATTTTTPVDPKKDLVYSVWGVNLAQVNLMVGALIVLLLLTGVNFSDVLGDWARPIAGVGIFLVSFFTNALGGISQPINV